MAAAAAAAVAGTGKVAAVVEELVVVVDWPSSIVAAAGTEGTGSVAVVGRMWEEEGWPSVVGGLRWGTVVASSSETLVFSREG